LVSFAFAGGDLDLEVFVNLRLDLERDRDLDLERDRDLLKERELERSYFLRNSRSSSAFFCLSRSCSAFFFSNATTSFSTERKNKKKVTIKAVHEGDILVLLSAILIFIFKRSCGVIFSSTGFSFSPFLATGFASGFVGVTGALVGRNKYQNKIVVCLKAYL